MRGCYSVSVLVCYSVSVCVPLSSFWLFLVSSLTCVAMRSVMFTVAAATVCVSAPFAYAGDATRYGFLIAKPSSPCNRPLGALAPAAPAAFLQQSAQLQLSLPDNGSNLAHPPLLDFDSNIHVNLYYSHHKRADGAYNLIMRSTCCLSLASHEPHAHAVGSSFHSKGLNPKFLLPFDLENYIHYTNPVALHLDRALHSINATHCVWHAVCTPHIPGLGCPPCDHDLRYHHMVGSLRPLGPPAIDFPLCPRVPSTSLVSAPLMVRPSTSHAERHGFLNHVASLRLLCLAARHLVDSILQARTAPTPPALAATVAGVPPHRTLFAWPTTQGGAFLSKFFAVGIRFPRHTSPSVFHPRLYGSPRSAALLRAAAYLYAVGAASHPMSPAGSMRLCAQCTRPRAPCHGAIPLSARCICAPPCAARQASLPRCIRAPPYAVNRDPVPPGTP